MPAGAPFTRLGIVVGMEAEAALIRPFFPNARFGISGATLDGARRATSTLLACGVDAVLSFGLAAGLDPALYAGIILLPRHVVVDGARIPTDPAFSDWLGQGLRSVQRGDLLQSDVIVSDAPRKAELFARSGCEGLDMESGVVAQVCSERKVPFAVLRVVCDPADRTLPPAAVVALQADGEIALGPILRSVLAHPGQIPALIQVGRDAGKARKAMRAMLQRRFRADS
ncbi:phosphorylase family protein [Novacetimonas pomaceti]|uniref:Nucleoside phosphorylase domain-containing protein n=1 Tax=Novacetimonas pomaceti TaxID=2021998 RepID=A0A318QDB9_9PROT|nr:hypothetical protein [Novacetimonas pomaceti]PYD75398.1 hypothetical protein CFR71_09735 [Novacetimonas pomaceti]